MEGLLLHHSFHLAPFIAFNFDKINAGWEGFQIADF